MRKMLVLLCAVLALAALALHGCGGAERRGAERRGAQPREDARDPLRAEGIAPARPGSERVRERTPAPDAAQSTSAGREASSRPAPVLSIAQARRSLLYSLEDCDRTWNDDPARNADGVARLRKMVLEAAGGRTVELGANRLAVELRIDGLRALLDLAETTEDEHVRAVAYYTMWYMPARLVRTREGLHALANMVEFASRAPDDPEIRGNLQVVLGGFVWMAGPDARRHVDAFAALARDDDPWKRRMGVRALGSLGPHGAPGLPALLERAHDPDVEMRRSVSQILGATRYGSRESVPALLALALDADERVRSNASHALRLRRPDVEPDHLQPLARHDDPWVRRAAYELGYPRPESDDLAGTVPYRHDPTDPPPPPAEPDAELDTMAQLVGALDDPDQSAWAFYRLTGLGPPAAEAIPHLLRIIEGGQRTREAVDALAAVAAEDPLLVPELIFLLEGGATQMARRTHSWRDNGEAHAARALGRLGARAERALPALRTATQGRYRELQDEARSAIDLIEAALGR